MTERERVIVRLTIIEVDHLCALLARERESGLYWGPKQEHANRNKRIDGKLRSATPCNTNKRRPR